MASILDVKRTRDEFILKKGKSSISSLRRCRYAFTSMEKYCLGKYKSNLENIIHELGIVDDTQEQVENLLQSYIDFLEHQNCGTQTVMGYTSIFRQYLKYRRVKFDKDELDLDYKKEGKEELYPITKEDIKTLLDHASFNARAKILLQSSSGLRISELLGLRKCDINTELERYTIHVSAKISKSNKARTTIISIEAMPYLDKLLENIGDNDFIFPHTTKNRINITVSEIIMFNGIRKKAGLDMRYEGKARHKITTHSFRAFFISQFEKTYSGFGHALSGHDSYMQQYERFTTGEKIEKYIETEKHLLIYKTPDQDNKTKKELVEIKAKLARVEELLKDKGINLNSIK